jgi:hypothetical protein
MPRANRYFIPGQIGHVTHCCHKREFLLKFGKVNKNRQRWLGWPFEAKKRYVEQLREVDNEGDGVQRQSTEEEMEYCHFVE